MKIIEESHIHSGIDTEWIKTLPQASEFKISIHESKTMGLDHCIKTDTSSVVYWERRGNRPNLSRVVEAEPVATNKVVTVEVPHEGDIVLATAYFGREVADKEPFLHDWGVTECEEWVRNNPNSFWANHALISDGNDTG